jgi:hypothetical protein
MITSITALLPFFQLILNIGNICILGYALFRFLNKPHDTLETRIEILENDMKDIKLSVLENGKHLKEQDDTNEVLIHSVLALIEFEIQYCLVEHKEMSEGLKAAKEDLNHYLARK